MVQACTFPLFTIVWDGWIQLLSRGFILSSTDHKRHLGAQTCCVKQILTIYTGISLANNANMSTLRFTTRPVLDRTRALSPVFQSTGIPTIIQISPPEGIPQKHQLPTYLVLDTTSSQCRQFARLYITPKSSYSKYLSTGRPPPSIGGVVQLIAKPLYMAVSAY